MKEIRYILILVIGSTSFLLGMGLLANYTFTAPARNWINVIPPISGTKSVNLTTSTFNVTGEKWDVSWWPSEQNPNDKCFVEVYDASTDEKLQQFTLSTHGGVVNDRFELLRMTGSFYLKIQVYKSHKGGEPWLIEVEEFKPPEFPTWITWIAAIGIASLVAFFGYKKLRHK